MSAAQAREFIDFWIENSVHATERSGEAGASQDANELARRCVAMAADQGITEEAMRAEVGDVAEYIRGKLIAINLAERDRLK